MALNLHVKFCGLQNVGDVSAAVSAGARYVGFVFFEKSPRNVSLQQAAPLALEVPLGLCKVALTVNADDAKLRANRLRLLTSIRAALHRVADFSKIAG